MWKNKQEMCFIGIISYNVANLEMYVMDIKGDFREVFT